MLIHYIQNNYTVKSTASAANAFLVSLHAIASLHLVLFVLYSQFTTISKTKAAFGLTTTEGTHFLPSVEPLTPSATLSAFLQESLPLAATGSEKARSEGIIYPVLLEGRRLLQSQISLFSGEDFTVDETVGFNGIVDFLFSRSPEVLEIEAPAVVIVEAKKADLRTGFGQCIAEMVKGSTLQSGSGSVYLHYLWHCQQW